MSDHDLRTLWQARPEPPPVDVDAIRRAAKRLRWRVRLRNIAEWAAAAFIVPFFALVATRPEFPWLSRVAAVIISLAGIFISVWFWRYGRSRALPDPSQGTAAYLDAHREQLLQQAELLGTTPRWYFLPLGGGLFLFFLGFLLEYPGGWRRLGPSILFYLVLYLVLIWGNQRAARHLRERAEALIDEGDETHDGDENEGGDENL